MDVVYLCPDFRRVVQVLVIPAAALPEAMCHLAVGLLVAHAFKEAGRFLPHELQCPPADRFLERVEKVGHAVRRVAGMDE